MVDFECTFDARLVQSHDPKDHGITAQTKQQTADVTATAIAEVEKKFLQKEYGFVETLKEQKYLTETREVFEQLDWVSTMVVVGIGGSDLGARAIQDGLEVENPPMQVLFHGDTTDPVSISRLFRRIDLKSTVFVIISKSGQTVETMSQYVFLKAYVHKHIEDWARHFVFITDPEGGVLRPEGTEHGVLMLPIPPGVGGRFSVLTPVGLLPALAMGVDIDALVTGALKAAESETFRKMTQEFAATQYQLYSQGTKVVAMMPYAVQLEEFCRWFRQLWAESLGKDNKGILPVQARGPADQHSQAQFYNQGEPLQSLFFLRILQPAADFTIEEVDIEAMSYLKGHSFQEMLLIEQEATALALKKAGRPSVSITIQRMTAQGLGELFMFFELAVVYVAEMLGVNAFDQPGVEEGKQMMYALLGKDGFADKKTEIDQLRQKYQS